MKELLPDDARQPVRHSLTRCIGATPIRHWRRVLDRFRRQRRALAP
jgi:hypothetical protein